MKTKNIFPFIIVFSLVMVATLSCSKNDSVMNSYPTPVTPSNSTTIGEITDSGAVSQGIRVMKMGLNSQNFTLYNTDHEVSNADARVKVAFYVNSDGSIPEGDYGFSDTESKTPFTFNSASLIYTPAGNSANSQSDQVVDGTINVKRQGYAYVFTLEINLSSGMTASSTYSGFLNYNDLEN
jgi:hypothetical protein